MEFYAEGLRKYPQVYTMEKLQQYLQEGTILESRALTFGSDRALHFSLNGIPADMPYEECADGVREGKVRDIALLTRVGRSVCFVVAGFRQQIGRKLDENAVFFAAANNSHHCFAGSKTCGVLFPGPE